MSRPVLSLLAALLASPAIAYLAFRLAKELGFLDTPIDRQHELRRTISLSLYAFLLFVPVGIYGFEKGWPRVWVLFGVVDGLALVFFATGGVWAARRLWKLRHPDPAPAEIPEATRATEPAVDFETGRRSESTLPGPEP
jgi:hypothetical protein